MFYQIIKSDYRLQSVASALLTHLDLTAAQDLSVSIIDGILHRCSLLITLSIEGCMINDEICGAIGRNCGLESLNLGMCQTLSSSGIDQILTGCQW